MKVKTNVKAGGGDYNRCESVVTTSTETLKVKTGVKAGGGGYNRCEHLRVKSGVKAGWGGGLGGGGP